MNHAIALNWYAYEHNAEAWDALAKAISEELCALGICCESHRYTGDTHQLLGGGRFTLAYCCGVDAWRYSRSVQALVTPRFSHTPKAGMYKSVLIARAGNAQMPSTVTEILNGVLEGAIRCVVNQRYSWSGSLVMIKQAGIEGLDLNDFTRVWRSIPTSGGHAASLEALQSGHADIALLDENSWAFLKGRPGGIDDFAVVGTTSIPTPSCPLVIPKTLCHRRDDILSVLTNARANRLAEPMKQLGIEQFDAYPSAMWVDAYDKEIELLQLGNEVPRC